MEEASGHEEKTGNEMPGFSAPRTVIWPPMPPDAEQPPAWISMLNRGSESCLFKAALSGTAGAGLGLFCGLLFGGYSSAVDKAVELEGPASLKLRVGFREAGRAMLSYSKQFAMFGVVFSTSECTVEKIRARHDLYNSVIAGCATGAIMASQPRDRIPARARAVQMAVACGGMAAFSTAIDYYMEHME